MGVIIFVQKRLMLLLCLLLSTYANADDFDRKKYQTDLDYIYRHVKETYANLLHKEKVFGYKWDNVYKQAQQELALAETEKQAYLALRFLFNHLHDEHSKFIPNKNGKIDHRAIRRWMANPFELRLIEGKVFVIYSQTHPQISKHELLSINNIDVKDMLERLNRYFALGSHTIGSDSRLLYQGFLPKYFKYFTSPFPKELQLTVKSPAGKISTVTINEHSKTTPRDFEFPINWGKHKDPQPKLWILQENNIALLFIPSFKLQMKNFESQVKDWVGVMEKKKVKGLIIDIRYNSGGNKSSHILSSFLTTKPLITRHVHFRSSKQFRVIDFKNFAKQAKKLPTRYVIGESMSKPKAEAGYSPWFKWSIRPQKNLFLTTIPVVLLVNENIYSSANILANICKDHGLATIVGPLIPNSGHALPNHNTTKTPSGNFILRLSVVDVRRSDFSHYESEVGETDYPINQTIEDFFNDRDTLLNKAISLIEAQSK